MTNDAASAAAAKRVTLRLRLEDAVALLFFLLTLSVRIVFRELRHNTVSPADVLIIIPAVTLLLAKELVHYFLGNKAESGTPQATGSPEPTELPFTGPPSDLSRFVRSHLDIVRDWFPFFVILMMYYSLWGDATHLVVTQDRDAVLMAWDQRLFGFQPSLALQRFVSPALTAWMEFAYGFHVWNIPLVACFIYLRRPRERFREMMCGVLAVTFLGLLGYILVPAIGPMYTLLLEYTVPLNQSLAIFNRQAEFMDFARIRRDVFPSLHVGISFVVWLYAYRNSRRLFCILSPLVVSLWFSTVYLRYHYVVDCIAGFALAPVSFLLANKLFEQFGEIPVALPVGWTQWLGRLTRPAVPAGSTQQDAEVREGQI